MATALLSQHKEDEVGENFNCHCDRDPLFHSMMLITISLVELGHLLFVIEDIEKQSAKLREGKNN